MSYVKKINGYDVKDVEAVSYIADQGLTADQQAAARTNIGAGTSSFSGDYTDLANKPDIPEYTSGDNWIDVSAANAISHQNPQTEEAKTSPSTAQTPAFGETFNIPVVSFDAKGHVIKDSCTIATVKIPELSVQDKLVKQNASSAGDQLPLLARNDASYGSGTNGETAYTTGIYMVPGQNKLHLTSIEIGGFTITELGTNLLGIS